MKDLGKGGYGAVKLLREKKTGELFAAKYCKLTSGYMESTYNEIQILTYFTEMSNSPSVELIKTFEDEGCIIVVMKRYLFDFCGLFHLQIFDNVYLSEITFVFNSLTNAIKQMHKLQVVHRDLKSANVLLDECGRSHIADFGIARFSLGEENLIEVKRQFEASEVNTSTISTLIYRAPEQLFAYDDKNKLLTTIYSTEEAFDLYALGVIFVEILFNGYMLEIEEASNPELRIEAVKLAYVQLYGNSLIEMCKECYEMEKEKAEKFIIGEFSYMAVQEKVQKLLRRPEVNLEQLLNCIFILRFKEEIFSTGFYSNLDDFIEVFSELLSCFPEQRVNPSYCNIFKLEIENIVTSLPQEALDSGTYKEPDQLKIFTALDELCGYEIKQEFNDLGCRYIFSDILGSGILAKMKDKIYIKEFERWEDIVDTLKGVIK